MLTTFKLKFYGFLTIRYYKKANKKHDKFMKHKRKADFYHNKHGRVFEEFISSVKKKVNRGGNR